MDLKEIALECGYDLDKEEFISDISTYELFVKMDRLIRNDQRKRNSRVLLRRLKKDMSEFSEEYTKGYMKAIEHCNLDIRVGYEYGKPKTSPVNRKKRGDSLKV
jgi:predicted GNAT superfamily acetyltransferase